MDQVLPWLLVLASSLCVCIVALCLPVVLSRLFAGSVVLWIDVAPVLLVLLDVVVVGAGCVGGLFTLNHVSPVYVSPCITRRCSCLLKSWDCSTMSSLFPSVRRMIVRL